MKGLEYKRGDALRLSREMQKEAIDILLDISITPSVEDFREFVARWRARILEQPLSVSDIVLSQAVKNLGEYATRYTSAKCTNKVHVVGAAKKGLQSCGYDFGTTAFFEDGSAQCPKCGVDRKLASQPAHVRVAKLLVERGVQVTEGTRIEYLIVGRPDDEEDDGKMVAIPAYDVGALERIDRNYYWDKRILPPTARLLEAVFPAIKWSETAASRRKLAEASAKAAAAEQRRINPSAGLDELPLFGGASRLPPAPVPAPRPVVPSPSPLIAATTALKPRKPRAPKPPPPPDRALIVVAYLPDLAPEAAEAKLDRNLATIREVVKAFPGRAPMQIQVVDRRTGEVIRDEDGGMIVRSDRARLALERVVGVGNVKDAEASEGVNDGSSK